MGCCAVHIAGKLIDEVVLATTNLPRDDVLAEMAERLGASVFRGDEADVLARYARAAEQAKADTVVRVCADRPLVDPDVVDLAVETFGKGGCDLAFNHIADLGENWPRGFGAEVLGADLLHWMDRNTTEQPHREHVTLYVWDHRGSLSPGDPAVPGRDRSRISRRRARRRLAGRSRQPEKRCVMTSIRRPGSTKSWRDGKPRNPPRNEAFPYGR